MLWPGPCSLPHAEHVGVLQPCTPDARPLLPPRFPSGESYWHLGLPTPTEMLPRCAHTSPKRQPHPRAVRGSDLGAAPGLVFLVGRLSIIFLVVTPLLPSSPFQDSLLSWPVSSLKSTGHLNSLGQVTRRSHRLWGSGRLLWGALFCHLTVLTTVGLICRWGFRVTDRTEKPTPRDGSLGPVPGQA